MVRQSEEKTQIAIVDDCRMPNSFLILTYMKEHPCTKIFHGETFLASFYRPFFPRKMSELRMF